MTDFLQSIEINQNEIMKKYCSELEYEFLTKDIELPAELSRIINSDFITNNDCITLKGLHPHKTNPNFKNDFEKCKWEDGQTHFHPDNYIENKHNEIEFLMYALESGKQLMKRLKQNFPVINFRIFIFFSKTNYNQNGEIEFYGSSNVRFHKIRNGAEKHLYPEHLDDFKSDGVMEITV